MPSTHRVNIRSAGHVLEGVALTFGCTFPEPRDRGIRDGHGFDIELPAVLDLLEQIERGDTSAGDVRAMLLRVVALTYDPADCWRYEDAGDKLAWCRRDGSCPTCEEARTWMAALTGPKGGRQYRRCAICAPAP